MLKEKYADLLTMCSSLNIKDMNVSEDAGKLKIKGTTSYQREKDLFWDKVKTYPTWQQDLSADIKVETTEIYGKYTIQAGDTLSKLAKTHLGEAGKYMEIFNINKDVISNPDMIKVGQTIKLPMKEAH